MLLRNRSALALLLFASLPAAAQLSQNMQDWMTRLNSGDFAGGAPARAGRPGRGGGGTRWVDGGKGYSTTERGEIVRYDAATGQRSVLMSAAQLTPPTLGHAIQPTEHSATADGKHMLFGTNPRPTMIRKTAYDYWALDLTDNSWHKLGGSSPSVLYAKL